MKVRHTLSAWVAAAVLLVAQSGRAEDAMDQARKRYAAGEREYASGRYWQSAKAFEEAYDLSRKGDLLYNAARAYDRGEYYLRAIETYEAYLKTGTPPDAEQITQRIAALRKLLSPVQIKLGEKAYVFVDGHEYYQTPMNGTVSIDSGYHRIEVRAGNRFWAKEQQFVPGERYEFDAQLEEDRGGGQGLVSAASVEESRSKPRTRQVAVVIGAGGSVDVLGNNYPPHQASLVLGAEYRVKEGLRGAFDLGVKIPIEFLQSWTNAGLLIGARGALTPVPRIPFELVLSLDLGFATLDYRSSAPVSPKWPCASPSALSSCSIYAFRVVPALSVAYRFAPAFEVRAQLAGVELNLSDPIFDPRLSFGIQAAYRFF